MEKEPSYDWHSLLETDRDKSGFEFYQNINQFEFDSQKAILEDHQQIRIVSQNFGFDIGNNIKEVPLNDEYYYINVIARKK